MIYCDTSLPVAIMLPQGNSGDARRWFGVQPIDQLVANPWTATNVGSALALKRRLGKINDVSHANVVRMARGLLATIRSVLVTADHFVAAGERFVTAPPSGLRADDALHLAIAFDDGSPWQPSIISSQRLRQQPVRTFRSSCALEFPDRTIY